MMRLRHLWTVALMVAAVAAGGCSKKDSSGGGSNSSGGSQKSSGGKGGSGGQSGGGSGSSSGSQNDASNAKQDKSEQGGPQPNDVVKIAPEDQQRAGIIVGQVEVRSMPRTLTVAGQVQMDEQHTSHIGAYADGPIMSVSVLPGAEVRRGQTLATLHSHTIHETAGALAQAYAAVERQRSALSFAQTARERYTHLYGIQAASLEEAQRSDQEVQQAKNMLTDAEANVHMETEHLSELLQVQPESITRENLYDRELVPVRSPMSGTVINRNVTVGQVITTGFETFTVSNLSTVWVTASVNEKDLALVKRGAAVQVTTQGFADTVFPGRVAMLGDQLDPETRTVPVRITVANPGVRLRPGMFATANIAGTQTRDSVFIPEEAMQDINGLQVVFVTDDGSNFRAQAVKAGTRDKGRAEILEGLKPGDKIVTNGAFMVKSQMLKGTMGEG